MAASEKLTVTPAQMAAPVQLEALPVAVGRADGESVTRQEIWSPRAALGQSLRLIQLLTLRTLLCSRGGHANISRIQRNENLRAASVGVNYNITAEVRAAGLRSTSPLEGFRLENGRKRR